MNDEQDKKHEAFDELLGLKGPVMLVGKQLLKVASCDKEKTETVFPPSYANPSEKKDDPPVYNIDPPYDPKDQLTHNNVCVLDSIPSQANRMEPIFKEDPYCAIVPQYAIDFGDGKTPISILEIGHRVADAAFRGTILRDKIVAAFREYARGNATKLAEIGPTSLVFGVWDSRGTGVKVPRLINSIIRAFNVRPLKRSAQYTPPIKYEAEGQLPAGLEGKPADHGLADVPSTHKIGGIQVFGDIRRDFSLNLELLRDLHAPLTDNERKEAQTKYESEHPNEDEDARKNGIETAIKAIQREADLKLQRYILGLALLAFTATQKTHLRQGCQLLPQEGKLEWKKFFANGEEDDWTPDNTLIAEFAKGAARKFNGKMPAQVFPFDKSLLKASIDADAKKKADKKAESAGDPIENLKNLADRLDPIRGDKFSTARTAPLAKLKEAVDEIEANPIADDTLKTIAAKLRPLLTADAGAAERKQQMLAMFPSTNDTGSSEQADQATEPVQ